MMIWIALLAVALGASAALIALWQRVNAVEDAVATEAAARALADMAPSRRSDLWASRA